MSDAFCECPHCRRRIIVRWNWDTLKTAYLHDEDGEVVTDSDCLDAMRVAYQRHVRCPHCGTLTVAHLDHTPENCSRENLKAMCSPCHLRYDARQHAETRRMRKNGTD